MTTIWATPTRRIARRGRVGLGRRRGEMHDGDRVVRVRLGYFGRTYAYTCRGNPQVGTLVEVPSPITGPTITAVIGFGRDGYDGPLKRARIVR